MGRPWQDKTITDPEMTRPLFSKSLDDLVAIFESSNDNLRALRTLLSELEHRNTAGAKSLKAAVSNRIVGIMEQSRSNSAPDHATEQSDGFRVQIVRPDQAIVGQSTEAVPTTDETSASPEWNNGLADTLNEIRQRLLDLTRRNALLNYRHPRGRSIRVIDEMLDQLFDRLLSEDRFIFEPLPRVPLPHEEMPDSTREFLEAQNNWRRPSRTEWAKMHDIEPGFELPQAGSQARRHTDLVIQTLLFPDELETRLRSIAANARTAIEESGANILYLAFGFLEWTESDDSDQKSLAPLVLLPITLKKAKGLDSRTRREKYGLEYSGEDLQSNLSLKERLIRDFSLELPDLEDEDTPEEYISRCQGLLIDNPSWSIHRFVTLGFFQFGKLLMYLDLDPERWPEGSQIQDHPQIDRLLTGSGGDGDQASEPVDVDSIPLDAPEALIIEGADSSQHQAIVDASKKRSMVIEGPPGTGKSQTITNIIGVSLAQGKSVLFVSEKLAALEVVKSRLEKSGLGEFCLELHSHKTQKRKFLDDLEKRVEMRRPVSRTGDHGTCRTNYENRRAHIANYLRAVNKKVADYDQTRHDLFCKSALLGSKLPAPIQESVSTESLDEAPSPSKRQQAINLAKKADEVRQNMETTIGKIGSHPLYGLIPVSAQDAKEKAADQLRGWWQTAVDLHRRAFGPEAVETTAQLQTTGMLRTALAIYELLDRSISDTYRIDKLCSLQSPTVEIKRLLDIEQHVFDITRRAAAIWHLERNDPDAIYDDIKSAMALLQSDNLDLTHHKASQISEINQCLDRLDSQISDVAAGVIEIQRLLGVNFEQNVEGIDTAAQSIMLSAKRPRQSLDVRQPVLESLRNYDLLDILLRDLHELKKSRAKLSMQFDLPNAIDVEQIEAVTPILRGASLLSRFSSEWRSANEIYQRLRHKKTWFRTSQAKARDFDSIVTYYTKKRDFERNSDNAGLLGPMFKGMDTPADEVVDVCKWYRLIRESLSDQPDLKGAAGQRLMRLEADSFSEIDAVAATPFVNAAVYAKDVLASLNTIDSGINEYLFSDGWQSVVEKVGKLKDRVQSATELIFKHCSDNTLQIDQGFELLSVLLSLQADTSRVELHAGLLSAPRKRTWEDSEIGEVHTLFQIAQAIDREEMDSPIRRLSPLYASSSADVRDKTSEVGRLYEVYKTARSLAETLFELDDYKLFGGHQDEVSFSDVTEKLEAAQVSDQVIDTWCSLAESAESIEKVIPGLERHRNLLYDANLHVGTYSATVEYLTLAKVADREIASEPTLENFNTEGHAKILREFRSIDDELRAIASNEVAVELLRRNVPAGQSGKKVGDLTELKLLRHEIGKQRRHLPIRKLVHRAGRALKALKPCFMMGPLSVAQYLTPGEVSFDIIVMDEASQMRPEDSLGAIARGSQLIVVGDPKQLPPTSFFDRLNDDTNDDEDEALTFGAQESILDIAAPILGATRTLTWHYRSRHESLIAFSNYSFYGNNLLLFPTAHSAERHLGLKYHRVNGVYSDQTNEAEAQELVRAVVHEIKSGRRRSIGIVAVNARQANVLRDTWDRYIREMPEIEELLAEDDDDDDLERLFIKNLENVQGDERDVIFISLTYGKDANGNFYQRFVPINRDTGWRRLNVLFTRAREQMVVFSSMDSAMIAPGPNARRGVTALKDFLSYCESGVVPETPVRTGRDPDSPFEIDVANEVERFGLKTEFQVGVAGFFVDIGVYDPREPGHYLMGIECDGATYHSSQSARDRDKIRQEILENLGWNIYRIWSTDWFANSANAREKLHSALRVVKLEADSRASLRESETVSAPEARDVEPEYSAMELPLEAVEDSIIEAPPFQELESRLMDLRVRLDEDFPDVIPENSLLCDDLIAEFLEHRPTSAEEFHRRIPLAMREKIDSHQARAYLSTVLMIMEQ